MKKLTKEQQEIKRLKRVIRSLSFTIEEQNQQLVLKSDIIKILLNLNK